MKELTNQMGVIYAPKKKFVNKDARDFSFYSNIFNELWNNTQEKEIPDLIARDLLIISHR